ncbi:MAG TPA: AraC family transcriptional regulator [Bryobacteraceae bacterium]
MGRDALKKTHPALVYTAGHLDGDVSLEALAKRAGLSPHHFHREFTEATGETPKQMTLRLRLERAAAALLTGNESVLGIALECGFESHEVFSRAFRGRFGMTPSAYRRRGFAGGAEGAVRHAEMVRQVGPCVGLYYRTEKRSYEMTYAVSKRELAPQGVLVVRRRIKRSEIAATIAQVLPSIFVYAQQHGIALTGLPFARYSEVGPGLLTIEPGMRIASGAAGSTEGEVRYDTLSGGPAATTMHCGPYELLPEAYAAVEQWMEAAGLKAAPACWESYVTDPSESPDPKDWKTEIFWPVS